jgi:hypothetical protein
MWATSRGSFIICLKEYGLFLCDNTHRQLPVRSVIHHRPAQSNHSPAFRPIVKMAHDWQFSRISQWPKFWRYPRDWNENFPE